MDCKHTRQCAINIKVNDGVNILVMCVCMPYDDRWRDTNFEYVEVLQEVESLIYDQDPEYVVFGGDLNTDLSRRSPHTQRRVNVLTILVIKYPLMTMSLCANLQLLVSGRILICPCVILVKHIIL